MKSRSILVSLLLASSALQPLVRAQVLDDGMVGGDVITSTICGPEDDRVRSYDLRQGRLVTPDGTCTAWLISEEVFLTAGHCGIPDEDWRVHFTFDVDDAPEVDQYAVDLTSYASGINSSQGKDWGAGRLLPNSITENLPGVAQTLKCGTYACGWYSLGSVPSQVSGTRITITGYGVSSDPDDTTPQPQKTSTGPLSSITSSQLFYATDSMGGNSGGPILNYQTGKAIGIHTHGGCRSNAGSNSGTRIDLPELKQHISFLIGTPSPTNKPTIVAKPTRRPTHRPTSRFTAKPTPTM